jgi:AAA15 family ATPase/GTPase
MLTELHLQNIKSHRDTHIKCKPITALIGPNGSGKSTVLEVLEILKEYASSKDSADFINKLILSQGQDDLRFCIHLQKKDWKGSFCVEREDRQWKSSFLIEGQGEPKVYPEPIVMDNDFALILKDIFYCKPIVPVLIQPYYYNGPVPVLGKYGAYLSNMISYWMTQKKSKFKKLIALMNALIPSVKDINIEKKEVHIYADHGKKNYVGALNASVSKGTVWGEGLTFDVDDHVSIPIESMSEGTLSLLFILTVIVNSDQNPILLIDDIEQGLHPKLQRELIQNIKTYQQEHPEFQIIFTTHSPYILDCLEPDEVNVLAKDKHGMTHCKSLGNHPDSQRLLSVLTTGEFVAAVGEEWVIEEGAHG